MKLLQVDFAAVKDDEHFLFDSDKESDFEHAIMTPPLDLQDMAQDGKGPQDKRPPLPAAPAPAATADKKPPAGEAAAAFDSTPMEGVVQHPAEDVAMKAPQESAADADQPAKRVKTAE